MRAARYVVPFAVAAALFAIILLLLVEHGLHQNAGVFVYPLDDAYIHLAVSRNVALHGVWGISPYGFSGASSSPGWTLLLAAVTRVVGVHLLTPFVLNILAALLLLLLASAILARVLPEAGILYLISALCILVLVVPLSGLALIGMEHVLHSVAVLILIGSASSIANLPKEATVHLRPAALLLIAAAACGALRYESCFVIVVIMGVLLIRRRIGLAILVALAAAVGPVCYGLYSYVHSGILLPFSVVMKSAGATARNPLGALVASSVSPLVLFLEVVLLLQFAQRAGQPGEARQPFWNYGRTYLIIALATTVLHAEVGPTSWLMRYEAYLYVIGIMALAIAIAEEPALFRRLDGLPPSRAQQWAALAIIVALLPAGLDLLHRAHHGWSDFSASLHDRYVEHLPQALFVEQQMPHAVVLANDIGFLAFYADQAQVLDPLGLGSIEPVRLQQEHTNISPGFVAQWAAQQHAQLAILHTDFPGTDAFTPTRWVLVESWCFPHNLVFLNHVESFYAPDPDAAQALRLRLADFRAVSPEIVRYHFPQNGVTPPAPERGETAACPAP